VRVVVEVLGGEVELDVVQFAGFHYAVVQFVFFFLFVL
jgi:hypothetical protein